MDQIEQNTTPVRDIAGSGRSALPLLSPDPCATLPHH
jgi:hypothetical protein